MSIVQSSSSSPLVSVIIPAYDAAAFIERTLESVLAQTYSNIEVLVVDDGSKDRTAEIVRQVAQQDARVVLLQQANAGVAAARNTAIQAAQGEFIAPIDADDIWDAENLEKQVQCMIEADQTVGVVYSWSLEIDEADRLCGGFHSSECRGDVYLPLLNQNFIGHASATLIRRQCLDELGGYDTHLRLQNAQGCEDWDLYLRIAQRYQFNVVPEFLIGYRQVKSSMTQNYAGMAKSQELILTAAQQRYPLPQDSVYRWAKSRFFLYLAQRSTQNGNFAATLIWLTRAFWLDPIMVLLRHDFYLLFLTVLFAPLARSSPQPQNPADQDAVLRSAVLRSIDLKIKIRKRLPATLYNQIRLNWFTASLSNFRSVSPNPAETLVPIDQDLKEA